jgi:hypothetical protein
MERVTPRLRPGAQMMLLVSMRQHVPAVPVRYKIVERDWLDAEKLGRDSGLELTRTGPRYRQADLAVMMPGLTVRRCYLLRNGMQEYLLGRS